MFLLDFSRGTGLSWMNFCSLGASRERDRLLIYHCTCISKPIRQKTTHSLSLPILLRAHTHTHTHAEIDSTVIE